MKTFAKGSVLNLECKVCGKIIQNNKTAGKKMPRFCSKKCAKLFKAVNQIKRVLLQ